MGFDPTAAPGEWGDRDDDGRLTQRGPGYVALQTPSSFDWKEQGVLYVGKDLPDPGRAHTMRGSSRAATACAGS